jgi:hypothetical protein
MTQARVASGSHKDLLQRWWFLPMKRYRGLLSLHVPGPTLVVEGDVCEITFGHQETARLISPDHPGLDMNSN